MDPLLVELPEEIRCNSCVVRPYGAGDGILLWEAVEESREFLMPKMEWAHKSQTPEESEVFVRRARANWVGRADDISLGIFTLDQKRLLGSTGIHRIDWRLPAFEIGYWIRRQEQGKGYVTDAVRHLTDLCFSTLSAARVHIRCNADNLRSAAVARRLCFHEEGRMLNAAKKPDGSLSDVLSFGMTPEIWRSTLI